jgi:primosomal protein N''
MMLDFHTHLQNLRVTCKISEALAVSEFERALFSHSSTNLRVILSEFEKMLDTF